jgi:hypothetical protein
MKKLLFLWFFALILSYSVYGQQNTDSTIFGLKAIEFRAGSLFSRLYNLNNSSHGAGMIFYDSLENKFTTGFTAGISIVIINAKHITFQTEVVYNLIHHDIKYYSQSLSLVQGSSSTYANYSLTASFIQPSWLVKFIFCKKVKPCFGVGMYYNIPLNYYIKGQIVSYNNTLIDKQIKVSVNKERGLLALAGVDIPYKRNNFGLEFRVYFKISRNLYMDNPYVIQRMFSINLIYQWKRKSNFW